MKFNIKEYIRGLFLIDEQEKTSSIMFILFLLVGVAVYQLLTLKTLDANLSGLIGIIIGIVATMNVGTSIINSKTDTTPSIEQSTETQQTENKEEV